MIKPDAFANTGNIIDAIYKNGMKIANMKMVHLRKEEAEQFYAVHKEKPFYPYETHCITYKCRELVKFMTSGKITAIEVQCDNAIQRWRDLIGPTNTFVAKEKAPTSLRALYGTDQTQNACHGSDSPINATAVRKKIVLTWNCKEAEFYFGSNASFAPIAKFSNSTLVLIKPHAVDDGVAGEIIQKLTMAGFEITALEMVRLDKANAADFLEVYKGVVPEYTAMVEQLTTGASIVLEVVGNSSVIVDDVRNFCGPCDPDLARLLRPNTLRAKYGEDKVRNAVHCTDLEEDGTLEVEFFFNMLQK